MRFEWDDQKAIENLAKHRVSFGEATEVFYDPNAIEDYDESHSVGLSNRRLLHVVYAEPPLT